MDIICSRPSQSGDEGWILKKTHKLPHFSASSINLKIIQTPHILFKDFRADESFLRRQSSSLRPETCIDWTSLNFQKEDFFSNLLLIKIIYCYTKQPSITLSERSVLNLEFLKFKFLVFTFLRLMSCLKAFCQNCAKPS